MMTDQLPSGYRVQLGCGNCRHAVWTLGETPYRPHVSCSRDVTRPLNDGDPGWAEYWFHLGGHRVDPAGTCPEYTRGDDDAN